MIISAVMKNTLSKPMLLSCLVLASVVVAVLLWAGESGATEPEPRELQHGITVSSPLGHVTTWGRGLGPPDEAGVTVDAVAPVVIEGGELRRPW